jgi:hypothetical protein
MGYYLERENQQELGGGNREGQEESMIEEHCMHVWKDHSETHWKKFFKVKNRKALERKG